MASIFSRIVAGEIPCYKVAEDENYFAFLDISPVAKGHTLVIPKQEVDYIFDLDDETYVGFSTCCFARRFLKSTIYDPVLLSRIFQQVAAEPIRLDRRYGLVEVWRYISRSFGRSSQMRIRCPFGWTSMVTPCDPPPRSTARSLTDC